MSATLANPAWNNPAVLKGAVLNEVSTLKQHRDGDIVIAGSFQPGQQPGQSGEHGAVSPVRPWTGDLPPQHCDLMPQHQDLRVLGGVTARQEHQPAEHPDHEQVDKTDQHERRA